MTLENQVAPAPRSLSEGQREILTRSRRGLPGMV